MTPIARSADIWGQALARSRSRNETNATAVPPVGDVFVELSEIGGERQNRPVRCVDDLENIEEARQHVVAAPVADERQPGLVDILEREAHRAGVMSELQWLRERRGEVEIRPALREEVRIAGEIVDTALPAIDKTKNPNAASRVARSFMGSSRLPQPAVPERSEVTVSLAVKQSAFELTVRRPALRKASAPVQPSRRLRAREIRRRGSLRNARVSDQLEFRGNSAALHDALTGSGGTTAPTAQPP